jgi:hypothetical protein
VVSTPTPEPEAALPAGLMWDKKSNDGIHDWNNYYTWSSSVGGAAASSVNLI